MFDFIVAREVCAEAGNCLEFRQEHESYPPTWSKYLANATNYNTRAEAEKALRKKTTKSGKLSRKQKSRHVLDKEYIDYLIEKRNQLLPYQTPDFEISNPGTTYQMYCNSQEAQSDE